MEMWHPRLVRCNDGSLATGISTDVQRRFAAPRCQSQRPANGLGPLELVFSQAIGDHSRALRIEPAGSEAGAARKRKD